MAGMQFAMQHGLARIVFGTGLIKRTAENRSWHEWIKSSEIPVHMPLKEPAVPKAGMNVLYIDVLFLQLFLMERARAWTLVSR